VTNDDLRNVAEGVWQLGGPKLCYTLALALSTIAEELAGNSEPEKFLSSEECVALAQALMHLVPPEWEGDREEESPAPPAQPIDDEARQAARARAQRVKDAAVPTPVFKEIPQGGEKS